LRRLRRHSKPLFALAALLVAVLVLGACAFIKPGSLSVSQPGGIGSARVHFVICTEPEEGACAPSEDTEELQYLLGIAVPPGSTPPATVTAVPVGGAGPLVFTRSDEVATEIAAASANLHKFAEEEGKGGEPGAQTWPPAGLQGVGYLSNARLEQAGAAVAVLVAHHHHRWDANVDDLSLECGRHFGMLHVDDAVPLRILLSEEFHHSLCDGQPDDLARGRAGLVARALHPPGAVTDGDRALSGMVRMNVAHFTVRMSAAILAALTPAYIWAGSNSKASWYRTTWA